VNDFQYLHGSRHLDEELRVSVQVMDATRIRAGELRHRFDILPVGDCDEFGFLVPVFAENLDGERGSLEGSDTCFVKIFLVLVGP
jgi:hypothetical protein